MFLNESQEGNEEEILYDKTNVRILLNSKGTEYNKRFPLIKTELIFDPKFSLNAVCNAIKSEKHRRRWDPFISENKVLKTSESMRY